MKVFNKQKHSVKSLLGTDSNKLTFLNGDFIDAINRENELRLEWNTHSSNLFGETHIFRRNSFKGPRGFLGVGSHLKKPSLGYIFNTLQIQSKSSNSVKAYFNIEQDFESKKKSILKKINKIAPFIYEDKNIDVKKDTFRFLIRDSILDKQKRKEETPYEVFKNKKAPGRRRTLFREPLHDFHIEEIFEIEPEEEVIERGENKKEDK